MQGEHRRKTYEASTRHRTRHRHGYVDTCNVQNIERSTGLVSVSDIDTDACRTRQGTRVSVLHREKQEEKKKN